MFYRVMTAPPGSGAGEKYMVGIYETLKFGSCVGSLRKKDGSNFAANAVVNWNGSTQTTMYMTGNKLAAVIPETALATPGTVTVTVTNPGHAGGGMYGAGGTAAETSPPVTFTVH